MRIIAFRALRELFEKADYADSEASLRAWYHDAKTAEWKSSNDLKNNTRMPVLLEKGELSLTLRVMPID